MTETVTNAMIEVPRTTVTGRVDLYRDIHKGLRHALFDLTFRAGRLDPTDDDLVVELVGESRRVIGLLQGHHEHEEQAALEEIIQNHAASVVDQIDGEHHQLAAWLDDLTRRSHELAATTVAARAPIAHAYYLELAAFTGAYLAHLDDEERIVMPALATACDDEDLGRVLRAILASVCPEQQAVALSVMLPALCPAERATVVGRIRAMATPETFVGVRAIAAQVLTTNEYGRLELGDM
jgi:hemerythrin-like domain-containing protein